MTDDQRSGGEPAINWWNALAFGIFLALMALWALAWEGFVDWIWPRGNY